MAYVALSAPILNVSTAIAPFSSSDEPPFSSRLTGCRVPFSWTRISWTPSSWRDVTMAYVAFSAPILNAATPCALPSVRLFRSPSQPAAASTGSLAPCTPMFLDADSEPGSPWPGSDRPVASFPATSLIVAPARDSGLSAA